GDVALLGELARAAAHVLVVAPPLVHDQHAGTLLLAIGVPRDEAAQVDAVRLVTDFLGARIHRGSVARAGEAVLREPSPRGAESATRACGWRPSAAAAHAGPDG